MVFGALLGGMAMRAGERFNENTQHQRKIEDWQRSQHLNFLSDQIAKNWDDWDADQQMSYANQVGQVVGAKPKDIEGWITASKAIHGMIPQIQAVPESLGPAQRGGTVTTTPSAEPPVRGIPYPTVPQFSQLPAPGETLSPAIMAPSTGGTAYGPSYTPNQMRAQQAADQSAALRQQMGQEIDQSQMSPDLQQAARARQFGVNAVPVIASNVRGEAERYKADKGMLAKGKMAFYVVPGTQPGSSHVVHGRELGGLLFDESTGEQIVLPAEAEPLQQKVTPIVNDAGDLNLINQQRAIGPGNYRSTIEGAGRRTQPRAAGGGSGNTGEDWNALADAVMKDPAIMATLTPTARTKITPILSARGFTQFGKPMDDSQIKQLAQSQSSVESLRYLSKVIKENEDKMGPIMGWWGTLNPYSEARKVQADIDRVKQDVGKTLEGGVLRKEDEIKYKRILATLMDVPETAQYKLQGLIRDIERSVSTYQSEISKGGRAADLSSPKTGSATWSPEKRARFEEWKRNKAGGR